MKGNSAVTVSQMISFPFDPLRQASQQHSASPASTAHGSRFRYQGRRYKAGATQWMSQRFSTYASTSPVPGMRRHERAVVSAAIAPSQISKSVDRWLSAIHDSGYSRRVF